MTTPATSDRTGVAVVGRDGQLLLHTPGFVELLGLGDGVTAPGRRMEDILAELRAAYSNVEGLPAGGIRCQTGSGRTIEIAFERLVYDRCCVSITDISEQRAIEDELRRAQIVAESASQAKTRFLATMTHELRTPLNAVIGFSDALMRESEPDGLEPVDRARVAEFAGAIQQAGQHLLGLINNILDVARIESGRFDLAADLIDIGYMLNGGVRQATATADGAEITIDSEIGPGLPRLRGDERRLRQVLAHLLANAIKFTHAGGRIVVAAELAPDRDILIRVRDNGMGIPDQEIDRVFEPFHQLDTGLARRVPGAGLGLYFCRALVQAHGGKLTLESRLDEGTTATVRLPHSRLIAAPTSLELIQEPP